MSKWTTLTLPPKVKSELERLKLHRREPLYEVIQRLIESHGQKKKREP